eukprot:TRINITY_DN5677_c0_g1_i1.p1 TRINITY_DN5677_c0_g1~~TRINITY_DN5677_c0_g1_i1.p1  ORF type:complete len:447 (-),score=73.49 TRINITY_DN5677_c0_g1_i1:34-1374(-)
MGEKVFLQNRNYQIWSIFFQGLMILFFGLFTRYDSEKNPDRAIYPFFQDVHVMMFIGFGYLMTFMRQNAFSSVGFTFLIGAQVIQWCILVRGFIEQAFHSEGYHKIPIDIPTLINADYCVASVLIAYGAVLGKVDMGQLSFMSFMHVMFYCVNEAICVNEFQSSDIGGTMYIHVFGAYFGLGVSFVISHKEKRHDKQNSTYLTDIFAMIGTIFLWMYWPSFNSALANEPSQQIRTIVNTLLSLCACCVMSFTISMTFRHNGKLDMIDIQNATLAGGVAVGTCANMMIDPWGALLIGSVAGVLSTVGFIFIQPFLEKKLGLHDTCGVHNLHGMPGLLGGVAGVIAASVATWDKYDGNLADVFPARSETEQEHGEHGRSASRQAWFQLAALLLSFGMAISGGLLTGLAMRFSKIFRNLDQQDYYDDDQFWNMPPENPKPKELEMTSTV